MLEVEVGAGVGPIADDDPGDPWKANAASDPKTHPKGATCITVGTEKRCCPTDKYKLGPSGLTCFHELNGVDRKEWEWCSLKSTRSTPEGASMDMCNACDCSVDPDSLAPLHPIKGHCAADCGWVNDLEVEEKEEKFTGTCSNWCSCVASQLVWDITNQHEEGIPVSAQYQMSAVPNCPLTPHCPSTVQAHRRAGVQGQG
jgi:hypothetical protein